MGKKASVRGNLARRGTRNQACSLKEMDFTKFGDNFSLVIAAVMKRA
jgi:hypothetical protein